MEMKVEHEVTLTRAQVADLLVDLADALRSDGPAELSLSGPTLTLPVSDEIEVELEVEVEGDEIELELELSWNAAASRAAEDEDTDEDDDTDTGEVTGTTPLAEPEEAPVAVAAPPAKGPKGGKKKS